MPRQLPPGREVCRIGVAAEHARQAPGAVPQGLAAPIGGRLLIGIRG
jgi:hypothetical protein